jgi:Ca2+-binding EF-hand superfamily protein
MGLCVVVDERRHISRSCDKDIEAQFQADRGVKQSLVALFDENDANHDGFLSQEDLIRMFRKHVERVRKENNATPDISEEVYVETFMHEADKDGDGLISIREFLEFCRVN